MHAMGQGNGTDIQLPISNGTEIKSTALWHQINIKVRNFWASSKKSKIQLFFFIREYEKPPHKHTHNAPIEVLPVAQAPLASNARPKKIPVLVIQKSGSIYE